MSFAVRVKTLTVAGMATFDEATARITPGWVDEENVLSYVTKERSPLLRPLGAAVVAALKRGETYVAQSLGNDIIVVKRAVELM